MAESEDFLTMQNTMMLKLVVTGLSQRKALAVFGLSRSTWHCRLNPREGIAAPVTHRDRAYPNRIDVEARDRIRRLNQEGWTRGFSVDHSFAVAWDAKILLASRRPWWRIAEDLVDQARRPLVATKKYTNRPRQAPMRTDAWTPST